MRLIQVLFHLLAYYIAWFGCILLAAHHHGGYAVGLVMGLVTLQILWQIFIAKRTQGLWLIIVLFTCLGTLIDTLLMRLGLLTYSSNVFGDLISPPWMMSLWISFSVVFYALLTSFFKRYLLLGFLSLIFFPLAYAAGAKLNAAHLPLGYWSSGIVGVIWAILFPVCLRVYNHFYNQPS